MAVDLPPVIPPQEVSVGEAQQGQALATVAFQNYTIHVAGAAALSPERLGQAIAAADNLSNAVRAIASEAYAEGYPAARVAYALSGSDLFVVVDLAGVARVDAPAPLDRYFAGLAGTRPLTDDALEPRRALASIHADRAGLAATPLLQPQADGVTLDVKPSDSGPDPTQVRVEFGNPGTRYVGRYFLDVDLRTGTHWGDEFRAVSREGLAGLNANNFQGEYFEQNLGWNRVTPWGVFGLNARYLDFNFDPRDATIADRLDGLLWVGEAYWLYPLLADFHSRLTTQVKVDRTSRTTEDAADQDPVMLRELYTSAEVAATYVRSDEWLGGRWDSSLGLAVRKGASEGKGDLDGGRDNGADLDYLLYRPGLTVRRYFGEQFSLILDATAQITSDRVPEQQQWVLGGINNLATVLPGAAVGDSGWLGRLTADFGSYDMLGVQLRPRVFAEYGATRFENPLDTDEQGTPTLADAGVELGAKVLPWLEGTLIWAEKVTDSDFSDDTLDAADANLFFRIQAKF